MRSYGLIALIAVLVVVGAIYAGGSLHIKGKPVLKHLDSALGSTFFMGCYYKLLWTLDRDSSEEEDSWTKAHGEFEKTLRKAVE